MKNITQHRALYKRLRKNLHSTNIAVSTFKPSNDASYNDAYIHKLENRRDRLVKGIERLEKAYSKA
jgi:hypothetical protein